MQNLNRTGDGHFLLHLELLLVAFGHLLLSISMKTLHSSLEYCLMSSMEASILLHLDNQLRAYGVLGLNVKVLPINEGVEQEVLGEDDLVSLFVKQLDLDQVDALLNKDPRTVPFGDVQLSLKALGPKLCGLYSP